MAIYDDYLASIYGQRSGTYPVNPYQRSGLPWQPGPPSGTMPIQPGPGPIVISDPRPQGPQPTVISDPMPMPGSPPPLNNPNPRGFQGNNSNAWLNRYTGYTNRGAGDYNTELSRQAGELDPRAEYTRIANQAGMGGNDRRSQFGQNQFTNFNNAFNARQLEDTNLNLRNFINQSGGSRNLVNQWQSLTPSQRGLNNAGKSSVIRWG